MKKPRVETLINSDKDTVIQFKINDARVILRDILDKKYVDSLLAVHENLNTINEQIIRLDGDHIKLLEDESKNKSFMITDLTEVTKNKDKSIAILNNAVVQQKKEIRKQKFIKYLAVISTITLGILLITK
jgi:parvulin-like peptidyl-prolyl isomerase